MNNFKYHIRVFNDIKNEELKKAWIKLEKETNVFPQMYYEWIEPWWQYQKNNRKLHIITVINEENVIIAIAPFCIEKRWGVKVLRNIPIHFGDFYDFILYKETSIKAYQAILDYCNSFKLWQVCQINQINTALPIYNELSKKQKYKTKESSAIIYTDLLFESFDEFLKNLPKKQRSEYRRRKKRLSEQGKIELKIINTPERYNFYEKNMKDIYLRRWNHSEKYVNLIFKYRKEAYNAMLSRNKAFGFIFLLDGKPIAYRLGFIYNNVFTSWKLVYDPDYSKFSLGNLISVSGIEYLIDKNVKAINNGTGDYSYKRSWFNNRVHSSNFIFYFRNRSLSSLYYYFIEFFLKPKAKKIKNDFFK